MQLQIVIFIMFMAGINSACSLGLPLDADTGAVPKFLSDIYNCWNSLGANQQDRASCLPVSNRAAKNLNEVNAVRSIEGKAKQATSDAISHTPQLTFHFNVSIINRDIRYAYITIPKQALSEHTLQKQCNGPITLQLLMRAIIEAPSHNVFTLLSSTQMTLSEISRSDHVEFSDITQQFQQWQTESTTLVEIRLVIHSSCYNRLLPEDVGFKPNSSAYIAVFSKSDTPKEAFMKARLAAAAVTASRETRNTHPEDGDNPRGEEDCSSGDGTIPTNIDTDRPLDTCFYHLQPCQLYSHMMSFEFLGWSEYILAPVEFNFNFCAGHCAYPLASDEGRVTKHSYIQSLASAVNRTVFPPPCCVPHELGNLTVLFLTSELLPAAEVLDGVVARSCGCK